MTDTPERCDRCKHLKLPPPVNGLCLRCRAAEIEEEERQWEEEQAAEAQEKRKEAA